MPEPIVHQRASAVLSRQPPIEAFLLKYDGDTVTMAPYLFKEDAEAALRAKRMLRDGAKYEVLNRAKFEEWAKKEGCF